jgi:hypothetical protein
MGLDRDRHEPG